MSKSFTPRDYQNLIINHMIEVKRGASWVFMGAGKTVCTLKSLDIASLSEDIYPALILAPLRVARSTWSDEIVKWTDFRHMGISTVIGNADARKWALKQHADIFTMNYENLPWLAEYYGDAWPFKTIVADESTRLKSFRIRQGGSRAAVLRKYVHTKVKRFVELTGTPSPNGLKDLWGQIYLLDQGERLGRTYEAFEQRWFAYRSIKDAISHKTHIQTIIMPHAQEQIQERLKDICLSLNAADYFDIEKPIITPVYVDLDPPARKLYREMEKNLFIKIERHEIEAFSAASKTNKLLQLAAGAAYIEHDVDDDNHPKAKKWKVVHNKKLEALESIVEEAGGIPVLVAYNFKSDLVRLKEAFPKGRHINTKKDEDDFKAGLIQLAFAHPASLGHGVDGFQYVTNICVFFSADWNLENFLQFIERIGPVRQIQAGFKRNVFVYIIVARNTMDEDVLKRHETKKSVMDILLESVKRRN